MNCVAYIRTVSQEYEDALTNQMEMIQTFISEKNWKLESVYTDVESAVKVNEYLHKMIEDAKKGKIDVIVTTTPSRISRNNEIFNAFKMLCESNKIHLFTLDNQLSPL